MVCKIELAGKIILVNLLCSASITCKRGHFDKSIVYKPVQRAILIFCKYGQELPIVNPVKRLL
jgi:hypothetical protein